MYKGKKLINCRGLDCNILKEKIKPEKTQIFSDFPLKNPIPTAPVLGNSKWSPVAYPRLGSQLRYPWGLVSRDNVFKGFLYIVLDKTIGI